MEWLAIVGALFLAYYGINFFLFLLGRLCSRDANLYEKYNEPGKKTYAVVTGGSDGIGLAMCHDLAR